MSTYCPKLRDIIHIDFDPQVGKEQTKRRPALVLSAAAYNEATGRCIVCPFTSSEPNNRFQIPLPTGLTAKGVVISDQVKSLDWTECMARFRRNAPERIHDQVLDAIYRLLEFEPS